MKHTDLPSPGLINKAGELRLCMAQAISYVQTMAKYQANGKSKHAVTLSNFLTATQSAVSLLLDGVVPVYSSGSVNGNTVQLVYSEQLKATLTPPAPFVVQVDSITRVVTAVSISGSTVSLTLTTPVTAGQVVTTSYTGSVVTGEYKLQDPSGNFAASRSAAAVTNLTP